MTIPLCQQCGDKIYMRYGQRGYLAQGDSRYHFNSFKIQEEYDAHEIPSNAFDVNRYTPTQYYKQWRIIYSTPQQPRDGLFHNRGCWEDWHESHRDDIERLIKTRGEWKS